MVKKRSLADLYVVGRNVVFDDGTGDPITVWLQKLNPVEHETAMRRAAGARARVISGKDEAEIELAHDEAASFGRAGWIEYLSSEALGHKLPSLEAELAAEEEWSENDYLQGLKDVWAASMEEALKEDPDDVSAIKVRDELARFQEQLEKRVEGERERIIRDFDSKADEDLERRVVDRLIVTRADLAWLNEFRKCEIWMATRDPDNRRVKYFEKREELDHLSHEVMVRLMQEYQELAVDPQEGKGSGATPNSSSSSESPDEQETDESSGLVEATA